MRRPRPEMKDFPELQLLQAWEDMRLELWHELEDGADADVPDAEIDEIGDLLVLLETLEAERRSRTQLPLCA